jgi:hypothetical protein
VARLAAAGRTDISVFCAEQDTPSPIFRFLH